MKPRASAGLLAAGVVLLAANLFVQASRPAEGGGGAGRPDTLLHELVDPGFANLDERELRRDEEAVQRHEEQRRPKTPGNVERREGFR